MHVEIRNLRKHFGKTVAVDDISFSFETGEIVGFVGPNGAGKTTTMRIMATLEEPTGGDVFINGHSVLDYPDIVRRQVGFVPDSLPTQRDMTVHEYLDFFARVYGLKGQERTEIVAGIEAFTRLTKIREKSLHALSKGMKQRVNLARSLVHQPSVLILDEPAAGLDPRARVELRELLKALAEQGKGIFISSHILTELAEICDSTVIIEQGRLLRAGKVQGIMDEVQTTRVMLMRALDRQPELVEELLQMPHIESARLLNSHIEAIVEGDDATCADLLGAIVAKGYRVAEYQQARKNLEDIFMNITKGEVQ